MPKIPQDVIELLEKPVDVKRLVSKLYFKIDELEDAALEQPTLFLRAGRFQAQSALTNSTLRRRFARTSGEHSIHARHKREGKTETAIKNQVVLNKHVQSAQRKLDHAEAVYEFSKQLTETFKERLMVLSILARLRASETNSELRSVKNEEVVSSMRKKAHKARKQLEELGGTDDF